METLGEYLQKIRKKKGLGVDQIAEKTRINPAFIRALEEERFEQFPGETFAKGFVRSYARSLGLDEREILKRFKEASTSFFSKSTENEREIAETAEKESRRQKRVSRIVQTAILVLIGTSVWLVYDLNSTRVTPPPVFQGSTADSSGQGTLDSGPNGSESGFSNGSGTLDTEEKQPGSDDPGSGAVRGGLSGEGLADPIGREGVGEIASSVNLPEGMVPVLENPDPLILRIEAVEDSWILAHMDGIETKEVFLREGETVTWKASEKFEVDFGNAGGVTVSLDGEILPSLGKSGQVKKGVIFTRE